MTMPQMPEKIVVLGTGGTMAGTARCAADNVGYTAAQVGVAQLLDAVPDIDDVGRGAARSDLRDARIHLLAVTKGIA